MKKKIHVNQHIIRSNRKNNEREPVLTVKTYKSNDYCHEAIIDGPCRESILQATVLAPVSY